MKTIYTVLLLLAASATTLRSQDDLSKLLGEIEENNTTLQALRQRVDAGKIGVMTGNTPPDPEVEFNYLFGTPEMSGNRADFRITQSFDFPTAYIHKNRISELKADQLEYEYKKQRLAILADARLLIVDLAYRSAIEKEYTNRIENSEGIASSYKEMYDRGEAGVIDYNKARLNYLNVSRDGERNLIEKRLIVSELTLLNGGKPLSDSVPELMVQALPDNFEEWYDEAERNNPFLAWLKTEIEINMVNEKLAGSASLPKIKAGYMSETLPGEPFRGVTTGISIPLWENRSRLKYARASTLAAQNEESDSKLIFYNRMRAGFNTAQSIKTMADEFRQSLALADNRSFLDKSFKAGEISLAEYLYELSVYYESVNLLLESEWEYNRAVVMLTQYSVL